MNTEVLFEAHRLLRISRDGEYNIIAPVTDAPYPRISYRGEFKTGDVLFYSYKTVNEFQTTNRRFYELWKPRAEIKYLGLSYVTRLHLNGDVIYENKQLVASKEQ